MRRLALCFAFVLGLAGCATVPTSGPIVRHDQQYEQSEGGVEIAPEPPAPGASPLLIVEGFLHATATYQQGYSAARQYLTAAAARTWTPEHGAQVYEDGSPMLTGANEVVLRTRVVGQVDERGTYTQRNDSLSHTFGLVLESGQWRISSPPNGILISEYLFRNAYTTASLYYLDGTSEVLVPDTVVVPRGSRDRTPLVRELLSGPSAWLAPVARSAVSVESGVQVSGVSTQAGGVDLVHLSSEAAALDAATRTRLAAQITWTLQQFDQATGVRLFAGDNELAVAEADREGVLRTTALARFGPVSDVVSRQLFGVSDGALVRVSEGTDEAQTTPVGWPTRNITSLAVDAGSLHAATVVGGTQLWVGALSSAAPQKLRTGSGLIRPQYSRVGELWSFGDGSAAGGLVVWRDGKQVRVTAPELTDRHVAAFRISPDGARLALILGKGDAAEVALLRIQHVVGGIRVEGLTILDIGKGRSPQDLGWLGAAQLAVSYDNNGASGVVSTDVSGAVVTDQSLPSTQGGAVIATSARATDPDFVVCDTAGRCSRLVADRSWALMGGKIRQLTYPS